MKNNVELKFSFKSGKFNLDTICITLSLVNKCKKEEQKMIFNYESYTLTTFFKSNQIRII